MNHATTSIDGKPAANTVAANRDARPAPGGGPFTAFVLNVATRPDFAALRLLFVAIGGVGFGALAFGLAGMLPGEGILYAGALAVTSSVAVLGLAFDARSAAVSVSHAAIAATVFALAVFSSPGSITAALILAGGWTLAFAIRQRGEHADYGLTPLLVGSGACLLATGTIGLLAIV